MIDYEYYYEQYRYVPRNSTPIRRDLADYHSTVFPSANNISQKRPIPTTYINENISLDRYESPYSTNGIFPQGRYRRKASISSEKKINTGDVSNPLILTPNTANVRSALSKPMTSTDIRRKSGTIFNDNNNERKFYEHSATAYANGAWIRRYKSIHQSHTLTSLLRDQILRDKTLLQKRTYQQLFILSSINKFNRGKY